MVSKKALFRPRMFKQYFKAASSLSPLIRSDVAVEMDGFIASNELFSKPSLVEDREVGMLGAKVNDDGVLRPNPENAPNRLGDAWDDWDEKISYKYKYTSAALQKRTNI